MFVAKYPKNISRAFRKLVKAKKYTFFKAEKHLTLKVDPHNVGQ